MASAETLRNMITERLTAAAEDIFGVFQKAIVVYEEEIDRQRRLLDVLLKPDVKLHRADIQQVLVLNEDEDDGDGEEDLADQQLRNQESSIWEQEDMEPPQIKEEEEEQLCSDLKGAEFGLEQEGEDFFSSNPAGDHGEVWPWASNRDQSEAEMDPADSSKVMRFDFESSIISEVSSDYVPRFDGARMAANKHKLDQKGKAHRLQNRLSAGNDAEKPFQCSNCSKGFGCKTQLKIHMKIHTSEKPFICMVCGKAFSLKRYLTQHMVIHSDGMPYSCKSCGKAFRRSRGLQNHMRRQTGENSCIEKERALNNYYTLPGDYNLS